MGTIWQVLPVTSSRQVKSNPAKISTRRSMVAIGGNSLCRPQVMSNLLISDQFHAKFTSQVANQRAWLAKPRPSAGSRLQPALLLASWDLTYRVMCLLNQRG